MKRETLFFGIILIVGFVLIYILSTLYPLHPDDLEYMYVYSLNSDSIKLISSFSDIIKSQYDHYFLWGGRVVVHSIAHVLLMIGKEGANIINTLALLLFIYVMYLYANIGRKINPLLYFIFFCSVFLFTPALSTVMLWITGSANYIWGSLIILVFLYPYYILFCKEQESSSKLFTFSMLLLGLLAGWSNENSSAAAIFIVALLIIYLKYTKKEIPLWTILGFVGAVIGFLFMIGAPGNIHRTSMQYGDLAVFDWTNYAVWLSKIHGFYKLLVDPYISNNILLLIFMYLVSLGIYLKTKSGSNNNKVIANSLVFALVGIVSFSLLFFSPMITERSLFFTVVLLIMAIGILWANISLKREVEVALQISVVLALLVAFGFEYSEKYSVLKRVDNFEKERDAFVEDQKRKGIYDVVYNKTIDVHYEYAISQEIALTDDPSNWTNKRYARYKGIKSIRVILDK